MYKVQVLTLSSSNFLILAFISSISFDLSFIISLMLLVCSIELFFLIHFSIFLRFDKLSNNSLSSFNLTSHKAWSLE
ncbi:hypothetical protein HOG21_04800 [bacterium]|nr:hypothetical protein [bacterium]